MAEYLSPGVYVEEFESGLRPMEGVGTSTAGFVGMAEKGNVIGTPEFVTSFADFTRKFGGYLSESTHGEYRYLAYSVRNACCSRRCQGSFLKARHSFPECKEPRKVGK